MAVCESCVEVLEEEGCPEGEEVRMAMDMGDMIADHLCDQVESNGDILCDCACKPHKKTLAQSLPNRSAKWRGQNKNFTPEVVAEVYRKATY